ncbi:MAG TPA: hypothetical protein VHK27_14485, partial [Gammaproteobacteria bacterium]|nr:hypothetical protein [Gammaproteobacteria bacterium]
MSVLLFGTGPFSLPRTTRHNSQTMPPVAASTAQSPSTTASGRELRQLETTPPNRNPARASSATPTQDVITARPWWRAPRS